MGIYDQTQLNKDLQLITSMFGKRETIGFFTQGVFREGSLTIIDPYLTNPEVYVANRRITKETLDTMSFIGGSILQLALKAEDEFAKKGLNYVI